MKKTKISIKPIHTYTKNIKQGFYQNYFVDDMQTKKEYKILKDQCIFDNLIAILSLFWIYKKQNLLTQEIDVKLIKSNYKNKPNEVLSILKDMFKFCISHPRDNDYFKNQKQWQNYAVEVTKLIIPHYEDYTFKSEEEIQALKQCIEALLNYNFIDLYTFNLDVMSPNDPTDRYDYLTNLIQEQIKYLDLSYEKFKSSNSPNFSFIFKTILTLRKSLI